MIRENAVTYLEEAIGYAMLWDVNNGRTLCYSCHVKTDSFPVNFRIKEGFESRKSKLELTGPEDQLIRAINLKNDIFHIHLETMLFRWM
ncbi:hypothetical protein GCM10027423_61130 [Spirosoma arcticum]